MPVDLAALRQNCIDAKENVIAWSESLPGSGDSIENLYNRDCYCVWNKRIGTEIWGFCLLKHGNEFFYNGAQQGYSYGGNTVANNLEDMKPILLHNNHFVEHNPEFSHIYDFFDSLHQQNQDDILRLVGELLLRDAFYYDHERIENHTIYHYNENLRWNPIARTGYFFKPNPNIIQQIVGTIPTFRIAGEYIDIDTEAYLHYIDGIAQNEAVKYHHKLTWNGEVMDAAKPDAGRESCLLTLIYYIESIIHRHCGLCRRIRLKSAGKGVMPIPEHLLNQYGYNL